MTTAKPARTILTAGELIALLQTMPADAEVMFDLGEEFVTVTECRETDPASAIVLSANVSWYADRERFSGEGA